MVAATSPTIASVEGAKPKKSAGRAMELRIRRSLDGGHIVTHHHDSSGPEYIEPKVHRFPAGHEEEAAAHIMKHAGLKPVKAEGSKHENEEDIETERTESAAKQKSKKGLPKTYFGGSRSVQTASR